MNMNAKHYKDCQNNYRYLNNYEDDEFVIDKKIKRNYRRYKQNIDTTTTTDSDSFEQENEKQKSSMQNKTVRKVIEKFNRLCCDNSKPKICDTLLKPPEQIKISTHEINKSEIITDKSEIISNKTEKDLVAKEEKKHKRTNKKQKTKTNKKNSEKSLKKNSEARKLRCSEKLNNNSTKIEKNESWNMFKVPDEYIRFIDDVRRRNIIKYTPKNTLDNLQLSKNELKHFKSVNTQTSPYSSNTNILINVYNAPAPRIYKNVAPCKKSLQLKVSQDENFRLSITEEPHEFNQNDRIRDVQNIKSVKNCVQEFEEFMKKKGLNNDKNMDTRNITKHKSNFLTEDCSETLLSPKAKSVPY